MANQIKEPEKPQIKNRLTVVQNVYHQIPGEQPRHFESRFSRELETIEQPYERVTSIGPDWVPIDCGWLSKDLGTLVIENNEGQRLMTIPTPAEKKAIASRELEIGHKLDDGTVIPILSIPSGETVRFNPASKFLQIRCKGTQAKTTIQAFPR